MNRQLAHTAVQPASPQQFPTPHSTPTRTPVGDISVTAPRLTTGQDNNPLTTGQDTTPRSPHEHSMNKAEDDNHSDEDEEEGNDDHGDSETEPRPTAQRRRNAAPPATPRTHHAVIIFQEWKNLKKPPLVPRLTKRDTSKSSQTVGHLKRNCCVPHDTLPGRWIADPLNNIANHGRRMNNPVCLRIVPKTHGSLSWQYCDVEGAFIKEEDVELDITDLQAKEREIAQHFYKEETKRIQAYTALTVMWKARAKTYIGWHAVKGPRIEAIDNKSTAVTEIINSLQKAHMGNLTRNIEELEGRLNNRLTLDHRDYKRLQSNLLEVKLTTTDQVTQLQQYVTTELNIARPLFKPTIPPWVHQLLWNIADTADDAIKQEWESTLLNNHISEYTMAGKRITWAAIVAGWDKVSLVERHPGLLRKCHRHFW